MSNVMNQTKESMSEKFMSSLSYATKPVSWQERVATQAHCRLGASIVRNNQADNQNGHLSYIHSFALSRNRIIPQSRDSLGRV